MDISSIPPGFEALATFTMKREEDIERTSSCSVSASAVDSQTANMETEIDCSDDVKTARSLRRRPWINYGVYDHNLGDESDSEQQVDQVFNQYFENMRSFISALRYKWS